MSPRIEKIWGSLFGTYTGVKRKDTQDGSSQNTNQEQHQASEHKNDSEKESDQESTEEKNQKLRTLVNSAIEALKATEDFKKTGFTINIMETTNGPRVRISSEDDNTIRVLTFDDFIKLEKPTTSEPTGRGRLLDQKF